MRRGVTAPHKHCREELAPQFATPNSLTKHATLSPDVTRKPTSRSINRVTNKGTGWNSKRPVSQARYESRSSEETCRIDARLISTSHGIRPPSRHLTPPKAVGLDLPPSPMTPPNITDNIFERTWSHGLQASTEIDNRSRRSQRNLSTMDGKDSRPKSVKAWVKAQDENPRARLKTSSVRPNSREEKLGEDQVSKIEKKRPVTCKTQKIPLIVTVDNDSNPGVEKTHFGKIINRRVCSAGLAREPKKPLKKGTFRSSLDTEFLMMFD